MVWKIQIREESEIPLIPDWLKPAVKQGYTLEQLKTYWIRANKRAMIAALDDRYSSGDILLAISKGLDSAAFLDMVAKAQAYKDAFQTAKAAIEAATTKNAVLSIEFIEPA